MQTVAEMFNITFTCHKDPLNEWGSTPKSGTWHDENATFSGALGRVVNGEYDVSASGWFHSYERQDRLDFHFR